MNLLTETVVCTLRADVEAIEWRAKFSSVACPVFPNVNNLAGGFAGISGNSTCLCNLHIESLVGEANLECRVGALVRCSLTAKGGTLNGRGWS